jgi:hypothetical protein
LGGVHDQVESGVLVKVGRMHVQVQEDHRRQLGRPLVAVDEGVVTRDRVEETDVPNRRHPESSDQLQLRR